MSIFHKAIYLHVLMSYFFFFNDTATTEIYTLSLHDALPIYWYTRLLSFAQLALLGIAGALVLPWARGYGLQRVGALASAFLLLWLLGHYLLFTRTGYALSEIGRAHV